MGEIANDMMSGLLCNGCGVYLGDTVGYPCFCEDCRKEAIEETGEHESCFPLHPDPKHT
jgi:hypothetical protein